MRPPYARLSSFPAIAAFVAAGFASAAVVAPARAGEAVSGCYAASDNGGLGTNSGAFEGNDHFANAGNGCSAPSGSGGSGSRWDTRAFIGLSIPIEKDFSPHLNLGIRETNVNTNNFVYGAEANFSISLRQGLADSQLRLLGVFGSADVGGDDLLGNAGIGWDLGKQTALLNLGLQVPYARGFLDYTLSDKSLRAFLELNSDSKIALVNDTLSCGAGTVLADGSDILSQWAQIFEAGSTSAGSIFAGSFTTPGSYTQNFAGQQSTTAFVNGKTCYTPGQNDT